MAIEFNICLFFSSLPPSVVFVFFFFNDTATTEIYTLSLHDALPIYEGLLQATRVLVKEGFTVLPYTNDDLVVVVGIGQDRDRKSTRLNSSHVRISYAVFCLKKKKRSKACSEPRVELPTTRAAH